MPHHLLVGLMTSVPEGNQIVLTNFFKWISGTDKLTSSYARCSGIDFIFEDQPNIWANSEVH